MKIDGCDRAWAEINLDHAAHNLHEIRKLIGKNTKIMAVVKADAYGHGAVRISREFLKSGADRLAVSCLDEALQLQKCGITAPIQILSQTDFNRIDEVVDHDLIQTIGDFEHAKKISKTAVAKGKRAVIHVKIDTGMSRMGFPCSEESLVKIARIAAFPGIYLEGIMTHFASADEIDPQFTLKQFGYFLQMCDKLKKMGIHIPIRHAANSAATIRYPEMHLDMVRPGIALYGLYAIKNACEPMIGFKPVMTLKAKIISVNQLATNTTISYGRTYKTQRPSIIATIPAGYADGYARALSNRASLLIRDKLVPAIGTICMDHLMADVTDIFPDVAIGETVTIFGGSGNAEIAIENISKKLGTISYEVACGIGIRIPRVYLQGGQIDSVSNYLLPIP